MNRFEYDETLSAKAGQTSATSNEPDTKTCPPRMKILVVQVPLSKTGMHIKLTCIDRQMHVSVRAWPTGSHQFFCTVVVKYTHSSLTVNLRAIYLTRYADQGQQIWQAIATPYSTVLPEKLTDSQVVKKFLTFYGIPKVYYRIYKCQPPVPFLKQKIQYLFPHPTC